MTQNLLTIDMITAKTLAVLENSSALLRTVNRGYDASFAVSGAKIGDTLRIRLPNRYLVTEGAQLAVQEQNEKYATLAITGQSHVDMSFTSAELALDIDRFTERYINPAASQLAAYLDSAIAANYKKLYSSVGTPGTTPATSLVLLQAGQKLNETAAPAAGRYMAYNPAANAALIDGMKGLFNPVSTVSRQFKSGMFGEGILGFDELNMSQSIKMHTTGTRPATGATVATTVATQGASTIALTGLGAGGTVAEGDVFTVAGCYAVNPQTRESTGSLQQFVATALATADGAGAATVSVAPAMYTESHALATIVSFPQAGAAVVFMGAASTVYPQNLFYNKDAIVFATADLPMPANVWGARAVHNGVSLRILKQYAIEHDREAVRVEVLWGTEVIRRELGGRAWG